jgi:hypothetical protein
VNFDGKLFYKFKNRNHKDCFEYSVIYSLMDLAKNNLEGYPSTNNNIVCSYLMDNSKSTLNFHLKSFDLQQVVYICILSQEYENQDIKDAWVYGLKRDIVDMEKYKVFRTLEEFDSFIKNDFNTHKNMICNYQGLKKEMDNINGVFHRDFIRLRKYIECINEELKTTTCDIQHDLRVLQKREYKPLKINDELHQLTPKNLLDECVAFFNSNTALCTGDVVSTIKHMLNTKKFRLSDDFTKSKLDLQEVSFQYKILTNPDEISREEILDAVFNINNSELI